jgi:hypothetical protein
MYTTFLKSARKEAPAVSSKQRKNMIKHANKRPLGRPPGSKRPRGRPPGSKKRKAVDLNYRNLEIL